MKLKEFGPPGGARVPRAPLRSATDVYYFCYSWKSLSIAITSVGIHLRYCKDVISLEMRNWKLLLFCTFSRVQTYWIATNAQTYLGSVTVYCSDFTETAVTVMNILQNKNAFQQGAYRGISVQGGLCPGGSPSRGVSVWVVSIQRGTLPDRK